MEMRSKWAKYIFTYLERKIKVNRILSCINDIKEELSLNKNIY